MDAGVFDAHPPTNAASMLDAMREAAPGSVPAITTGSVTLHCTPDISASQWDAARPVHPAAPIIICPPGELPPPFARGLPAALTATFTAARGGLQSFDAGAPLLRELCKPDPGAPTDAGKPGVYQMTAGKLRPVDFRHATCAIVSYEGYELVLNEVGDMWLFSPGGDGCRGMPPRFNEAIAIVPHDRHIMTYTCALLGAQSGPCLVP